MDWSSGSSEGVAPDSVKAGLSVGRRGSENVSPRWGADSIWVSLSLAKSSTLKSVATVEATSSVSSSSSLMVGESVVSNSSSWPAGLRRVGVILVENIDGGFVETAESGDSSASETRSGVGVSEGVVLSSKGMEVGELTVVASAALQSGYCDRVSHAAVGEPAVVTLVQTVPPGGVELARGRQHGIPRLTFCTRLLKGHLSGHRSINDVGGMVTLLPLTSRLTVSWVSSMPYMTSHRYVPESLARSLTIVKEASPTSSG
ncbi:hypothetical protein EYF80_015386 [Liparis tanakae]|uniref:Uncharacterized protein n=1 Tax=Liparis tanakae TaxID=230148 RepID=A0A4Z2I8W4_9TELE|nr:hypothetical protein EYF80_015386 [Liparis tanakae]